MNILIIPSWFPSKGDPINGSFFLEQAIALANSNHNVTVLNVTYMGRKDYFRLSNLKTTRCIINGVQVISKTFPGFGIGRKKKPKYTVFRNVLHYLFKKYSLSKKIDVIHCHSYLPAGFFGVKLGQMYDIPVVVTEHASNLINKEDIKNKYMLDYTLKNATKIIAVGESLKNSLEELSNYSRKVQVVPNLVSSDFEYETPPELEPFTFASVGSLIPRKNYETLLLAFSLFNNKVTNSQLRIIGDGPEYDSLVQLSKKLKIDKSVFFLGQKSRKETSKLMKKSNAFILLSKSETFGVVYAEAISCGRPVISKRNGGAEYIINENNGLVIDSEDPRDYANAMIEMSENYQSFNFREMSIQSHEKYSSDNISKKLTNIYKEVVQSHEK